MARIERFEEIEAWQKARVLTKEVYRISSAGDFARDFGLKDQIRRAAVSVMSNIAEGFERNSDNELRRFLSIAKGSCGEVVSQLYVACDLGYLHENEFHEFRSLAQDVSRLIGGFRRYLTGSDLIRGSVSNDS